MDIAIIGAGMGGLAAAAALAKLGMAATIYEQAPAFARVGAGIQLTPNAVKVLRGLGLEQRLVAASFRPEVGFNRTWDTGEVTYLHPMGRQIEERYGAPDIAMHRATLHAALVSCVPAASIRLGMTLVGLDQGADGVRLRFENGRTVRADAVIGADGIHSVVRRTLFGAESAHFTGQVAYRAVFPARLIGREVDHRVKWWGVGRHIVSYKVDPRRDEVYFIASTPEPDFRTESWSAMGDRDMLLDAYAGFHRDARALLGAAPEVRKWALLGREPMETWTAGCAIVIGDAAHPMLPTMAQGAGSAMEDAVVLARCLAGVGPDGVEEAFARCVGLRRERTARFQEGSRQNVWMQTRAATPTDWVYEYDAWNVALG
jgi:6-hydroxynicotinate 3-monooxygenase